MPPAAPRPCSRAGCPELVTAGSRCKKHAAEEKSKQDAARPSRHERGYSSKWVSARAGFLKKNSKCARCGAPATELDHIEPHRGDKKLFWTRANWQPLCARCHNKKTALEDGRWGRVAVMPPLESPSLIPLTVVCGPRGAGKSALVSRLAGPHDLVIDLDLIKVAMSGLPMYQANHEEWRGRAMRERNRLLFRLTRPPPVEHPAAWLITSAPLSSDRQWWRHVAGARVILVLPSKEACVSRLNEDARRPPELRLEHVAAVTEWFAGHSLDPFSDVVVRDALGELPPGLS